MSNPFASFRTHPAALARAGRLTRETAAEADTIADVDAVGFFDWTLASGEMAWNRDAQERLGVPHEVLAQFERWAERIPQADRDALAGEIARVTKEGRERLVFRCRFHAGDDRWLLLEGIGLCWYDDKFELARVHGVMLDITEHERDKMTLARSEAQLRTIIATAPDAIAMIDSSGTVTGFNAAAERMFGLGAEQAIGGSVTRLMPADVAAQHHLSIAAYLEGRPARVIGRTRQLTARRANGEEFPAEFNVGAVRLEDETMFVGFITDLTERMESAQRMEELRESFLRTSRMNAMGTVAAGLAHELNQPLAASGNFLATAEIMVKDPEAAELLRQAGDQIQLAGDIIRRLRSFLAPGAAYAERVEIQEVVDQAGSLALLGRQRTEIELKCWLAPGTEAVLIDRVQLVQVLVNLIRNASEVLEGGGEIVVTGQAAAGWVTVTVTDNGPGFPPDLLDRTDDLFRASRGGMGLGLTICRRIVEGWGGRFTIGNSAMGGAQIRFTVPAPTPAQSGAGHELT